MTYSQKKLPFTKLMVSIIPKKTGTYTLWNQNGQIIYIGSVDKPKNLFGELNDHYCDKHPISIEGIYDFQIEVCNNPYRHQIKKLENHKKNHGYLPDYNEETSLQNIRGE